MAVKIFICYARKDEALLNKLKIHLKPLQDESLINLWHDREISAGTEWEQEISKQLDLAQIILLLISPDFMNSKYCYCIEMKRAIERHEQGDARVIPIILRHVYWQRAPFGKLQALPTNVKPLKSWRDPDEAFLNIVKGICDAAEQITIQSMMLSQEELEKTEQSNLLSAIEQRGDFTEDDFMNVERHSLLRAIHEAFNFFELKMLCAELGTRYEFIVDFQKLSFSDAVFNVIEYCQQTDQYALLVRKVLEARPHLAEKLIKQK